MTRKDSKRLPAALFSMLLLTAAAAVARPPGGGERFGPPGAGFGPGPGPGLLHGPVADRLDLTDEQRDQIGAILEAQRDATRPWHEDVKSLGAALEEAIEAEPFDEEAVRAVARQLADVRVELAVARARTAQEVRAVLTPAQRETLGEMRARHREHRGGFGGPGGRAFPRRGSGG